jgi:C4-dicarboxylate-specific signal transduction histidine kinase
MSWFGVALQRVLSEAIDCSPTPGTIKIGWDDGAAGAGWLRIADSGSEVTLDQPRDLAMPFDTRRVQPLARDARTGLGLTISGALMQMLGGELDIQGTPQGAVYRLRLATE